MIAFIDAPRARCGVEPICRVLPIAASPSHTHAAGCADPGKLPARARRDVTLRTKIRRVSEATFRVYGVRKVWRPLLREGIAVARCTVARLMRMRGLPGIGRGNRSAPQSATRRPRVRSTASSGRSKHRVRTPCGCPILPPSRPAPVSSLSPSSSTSWRGVLSAGVPAARLTPALCWMRWSKPGTSAGLSGAAASFIIGIAVCSTSRSNTPSAPNGLPRRALSLPLAASGTAELVLGPAKPDPRDNALAETTNGLYKARVI